MPSISRAGNTITPRTIDGFASDRPQRTIVHEIISGPPAVSVQPVGLRSGRITCTFLTLELAQAAEQLLLPAGVWTYADPDHSGVDGLRFVLAGDALHVELDPETRLRGLVTFGYQEVSP